ncbi:MAG: dihydroorotate dehydrogenase-like protein [Planctomycetales bacterium]
MKVDLNTTYLGIPLKSPLVASPCPLTERVDILKRLADAGAGAVVLPSLFQEKIEHDEMEMMRMTGFGGESFAEATSFFPESGARQSGLEEYLKQIEAARQELSIPVIASLNGTSSSGWERYASQIEQAGASALELNIYFISADLEKTGEAVEQQYVDLVRCVRAAVQLPLAVKIGPFFSSLPNFAQRLLDAGADGLVLFNRFLQPDIDLETLQVTPRLVFSNPDELRLPLRWTAILHGRIRGSIAVTTGVHSAEDVIKVFLAGGDVAMMASVLLQRGPEHLRVIRKEIEDWLGDHGYNSLTELKGSLSQINCPNPSAFERANYMEALRSYSSPW